LEKINKEGVLNLKSYLIISNKISNIKLQLENNKKEKTEIELNHAKLKSVYEGQKNSGNSSPSPWEPRLLSGLGRGQKLKASLN
jgi:type VI protein secretion system component Hcp